MNADKKAKIVIIGGGPAGLSAAAAANEAGAAAGDILILERDNVLGGILNQCIHNGFGLHTFKEELTGPEYAARFVSTVQERGIPYLLNTIVVDISVDGDGSKVVSAMNRTDGFFTVRADAVILAMGCRERPRGALNIPGYRPAGIYTAGTAQRFVNIEGRMPGHEVVILGSGDIGLIMARRMTLEGAKVKVVAELMPYSGGLKRNIVQCLDDFGIPLKLSHTVTDIRGRERVEAVTIAEVGPDRKPVPGTEETYTCDTLLLSCGLIPENELSSQLGVELSRVTSGPVVNESLETSVPGVFACGNVLHVHDLVDYVSEEAANAGRNAAGYVEGNGSEGKPEEDGTPVQVIAKDGVRYTVPSSIRIGRMNDLQLIRFRVGAVYRDASIAIDFNDTVVRTQKKRILAPGEMEQVILKKEDLQKFEGLKTITIRVDTSEAKKQ
ncbi:MAG: NAD(P)/FAD-dependent oxidoreductase [Lachnospiraceae bacterium]|jgi:NADPH-dependent 2,4-dienoyl-CoA reductase/sulfur reductase-like enzyme|nr:NAD(P)/FAD-dependent oxidoreductase [Lachnospiraceae bacterium]